ncbi:amidohydrolase family protein [Glaciecola petra]|uniref:Amidohydrolase family protein n=1 Tax=Glaciecola petra TaxID=3075602 RepID=A0ABU2ZQR9_9ALTE|nr:amidohydrolase family protein [Aestuariibacter sp. P117]MDT0594611.1 amidohydrolase family protein [Aestuariibacter sp. P117]
MKLLNKKVTFLLCSIITIFSVGQAQAEKIAITGAQVHTMSKLGILDNATVLIEDGKIVQVLDTNSVPSGYVEINASGKVITPGFIGAHTSLGMVEVSSSAGVVDSRVDAESLMPDLSTVGAAYDAQYAINPDSTLIAITRLEGFTSAVTGISRTGQLFNGKGAVISLDNVDSFDLLFKAGAYVHTDVGHGGADRNGESRAALWVALNKSLDEASFASGYDMSPSEDWEGMITRADAKVLISVVKGDIPLAITANRASDILQVIALKKRFANVNIILLGASDAWRVADQIAQAGIPVILDPEYNLPGGFDQLASTMSNAGRLHAAGVLVAIGMDTHNIRLAPQHAGNAVANGLPHSAAIAALTINVAKIFGFDNQLGSLETGKQADLVIWSGDPLEVTQAAEQVFIAGKAMPMESRQTKLRDRYLNRDTSKPVAYSK